MMFTPTNLQDRLAAFVKDHGFVSAAHEDGSVVIMIPAYHRETGERSVIWETVRNFSEARVAVGY